MGGPRTFRDAPRSGSGGARSSPRASKSASGGARTSTWRSQELESRSAHLRSALREAQIEVCAPQVGAPPSPHRGPCTSGRRSTKLRVDVPAPRLGPPRSAMRAPRTSARAWASRWELRARASCRPTERRRTAVGSRAPWQPARVEGGFWGGFWGRLGEDGRRGFGRRGFQRGRSERWLRSWFGGARLRSTCNQHGGREEDSARAHARDDRAEELHARS